jgi:hypothetical protein
LDRKKPVFWEGGFRLNFKPWVKVSEKDLAIPPLNYNPSSPFLTQPVLDTKSAFGVVPSDGPIDAGNHARATFEATRKFDGHLPFLSQGVKVCRTGIDAESFFTGVADFLIEMDVGFFVVFECIERQFLGNLHHISPK